MRAARHLSQESLAEPVITTPEDLPPRKPPVRSAGVPVLRILPFSRGPQPRRFKRVPTHVVGVHPEQRRDPRATLALPLRLRRVDEERQEFAVTLVTRNISSTGVFFLCPRQLKHGSSIELEVGLVNRPMGRGSVLMTTLAHVVRVEEAAVPGWYGIAATFDDVEFQRDEAVPARFRVS
ncbi:MAG TPA: PilZ domain-containing protein [Candidatus Dormibacteraeota bacterium]|nr:PilZ domain-containing protein [Candidatus Dormibacteraeota bacterium]